MELLVLSACGLVAHKYMVLRSKSTSAPPRRENGGKDIQQGQEENELELEPEPEPEPDTHIQQQQQQSLVGTPISMSSSSSSGPSPAPIPLGVRTLKTDNTGDVGYDYARYNEQFSHPQDPNTNVSAKPWMRMINAPYKPKREVVSEIPGPQDIFGHKMNSRVKKMESNFATSTVPVSSEKKYDRPVEQIATGNGSAVGFHIGAGRRYYKFLLNEQPTIESDGGPRGAFSGASRSDVKGDYRTVTQRSSLKHESVGPPVAVGVPHSSVPTPSFEIKPAHLETYRLDDHMAKSGRAPVQASASTKNVTFRGAHDENFDVLHTSLVTGSERFATGASGNRDTKIHVPLNNDPVPTYDQGVVPNFKIAKASDYHDQHVTARQMMIPEMSQNVSAFRKDKRPPVSGSTENKKSDLVIDTIAAKSGTAVRGYTVQAVKVDPDSFRPPADRGVVVAENTAIVSSGASAAHPVGGSNSLSSASSLFRTTQSMSELVGTPFIRGAGGKHASGLEAIHEATDTRLSEMESSGIRQGMNKFASSTLRPTPKTGGSDHDEGRSDVFKKSERDPVLVAPGKMGTNRVGAANFDVGGMISRRGLEDDTNVNVMRAGKTNNVRPLPSRKKKTSSDTTTTKDRRLGDVLNARLGSSSAMKKLLKNPYSLPAASRLSLL